MSDYVPCPWFRSGMQCIGPLGHRGEHNFGNTPDRVEAHHAEIAALRAELAKYAAIVEAAKAWRATAFAPDEYPCSDQACTKPACRLADAVDAAEKP